MIALVHTLVFGCAAIPSSPMIRMFSVDPTATFAARKRASSAALVPLMGRPWDNKYNNIFNYYKKPQFNSPIPYNALNSKDFELARLYRGFLGHTFCGHLG